MESGGKSKTDDIQRRLRTDILNGTWAPGARLRFAELRERYQCSTGVVREALPRLVGEGLVTAEPQLGFRVMTVSAEDLRHLTEARILMETLVLRRSVEEGDLVWETRLVAAHHLLASLPSRAEDGTPSPRWLAAHSAFHAALTEACGNVRMRAVAGSLRDAAEVYRCWTASAEGTHTRDVAAEHRRILEAALRRDADAAVAALTEHIQLTTDILLRSQQRAAPAGPGIPVREDAS
ncbi:GntR family transcriptional regulator [Streptomyces sp. URMC 129]|uniref:GntR family transcriptional regulator n=1 Tax=Streptomyces sp. URMC 129 TaxID=3423407 RepID=UPI003F1A1AFE